MMKDSNKIQFGIRTIMLLMAITAFSLVIFEHLAQHKEETFVFSFVFSAIVAMAGVAMTGLSGLFAVCIACTETDEKLKNTNLHQCFHMLLMGLIGVGPMALLVLLGIFS